MKEKGRPPGRPSFFSQERSAEKNETALHGDPDTPKKRNSDSCPGKGRLGVKTAAADAERTGRPCIGSRCLRLKCGNFSVRHEPFLRERSDEGICDKANRQHTRQNIHRAGVKSRPGSHAGSNLRFADIVDDDGTRDAGSRPGRQQTAMDCADKLSSEDIGEVGRDRCKTTAIHRQDDAEGEDEERFVAHRRERRCERVQNDAEDEEAEVGVLAADLVGHGGPEEAATDVKERKQAGEAGCNRRNLRLLSGIEIGKTDTRKADERTRKNFLQHWRGHADNADTSRHVKAEHRPDQPELLRLVGIAQMDVARCDHRAFCRRWCPAFRTPAGGRNAITEGAGHHESEVDHRHNDKCLPDTYRSLGLEIVHQQVGKRCANHGTTAKAHDGHACRHAATVRKPFDQGGHRRDVTEAKPDATDDTCSQPHQPELMGHDADSGDQNTTAPAAGGNEACFAWANALQPPTPYGGRAAEKYEEERINPAEIRHAPIALSGKQRPDQRQTGAAGIGSRQRF
ncbi:Hypothetical protein AT6N2_L2177 [Agrobacterium tumefaciens]|nr:Hypothetical protein AT6N2_L2177 [Agrobacterium tumefaciens]